MPAGYKRKVKKGDIYGNYKIIKEVKGKHGRRFLCENIKNGEQKEVRLCHLVTGSIKGMTKDEFSKKISIHGKSKTRIWNIWMGMRARCYRKSEVSYKYYGGRGIKVCDAWKDSFENFYNDMCNGYCENLTIERIDVDGDYSKENCRWATKSEQSMNKRKTIYLKYKGEKKPLMQWSKELGISAKLLRQRIGTYGWSTKKAMETPKRGSL